MTYYAEIRVFDDQDDDYICETVGHHSWAKARTNALVVARDIGGKIKINIFTAGENIYCIFSKTYKFPKGNRYPEE